MAVVALAAASGVVMDTDDSSSSEGSSVHTVDVNRGTKTNIRRRSEVDITSPLSPAGEEQDQLIYAVPVKASHVVTDWSCTNCGCQLIVELQVRLQEDFDSDTMLGESPDSPDMGSLGGSSAGRAASLHGSPAASPPGKSLEDSTAIAPDTWRNKLWLVMEITDITLPPYPLLSRIVAGVGLLFILISVVNFVIETHPDYYQDQPEEIFQIEAVCMAYFTLEFVLRLVSAPKTRQFLTDKYSIVDMLSILPFYVGLIMGRASAKGLLAIRILRLMRVFRVFKVSRYNEAVNIVAGSLRNSTEGLYLLLFLILLSTVFFSSALYYVEREFMEFNETSETWYWVQDRGDGSVLEVNTPFQSIMHSSWFCIVTLTTVGYGDETPRTSAGKMVAAVCMLCGTLVIAFPMVIIGQNFQDMYRMYKKKKRDKGKKWKYLSRPKAFDRWIEARNQQWFDGDQNGMSQTLKTSRLKLNTQDPDDSSHEQQGDEDEGGGKPSSRRIRTSSVTPRSGTPPTKVVQRSSSTLLTYVSPPPLQGLRLPGAPPAPNKRLSQNGRQDSDAGEIESHIVAGEPIRVEKRISSGSSALQYQAPQSQAGKPPQSPVVVSGLTSPRKLTKYAQRLEALENRLDALLERRLGSSAKSNGSTCER